MAERACPWCDQGFSGDIRTAAERGHLLHPLAWWDHESGCVVNKVTREKGAEGAEKWLTNVEKYVQGYVAHESWNT